MNNFICYLCLDDEQCDYDIVAYSRRRRGFNKKYILVGSTKTRYMSLSIFEILMNRLILNGWD